MIAQYSTDAGFLLNLFVVVFITEIALKERPTYYSSDPLDHMPTKGSAKIFSGQGFSIGKMGSVVKTEALC